MKTRCSPVIFPGPVRSGAAPKATTSTLSAARLKSARIGLTVAMVHFFAITALGATIRFDISAASESAEWAKSGQSLADEWYPRLGNLLASSTEVVLPNVIIRLSPNYNGVAAASGNTIEMSARRVRELPDDSRGVVIHELVHVVQAYPSGSEGWLTEGIADYLRCAIYESMPLSNFPRPQKNHGYRDSYKVAAGFLLWLESGPAPGIVRQVNAALRSGTYRESVFRERTGRDLGTLWNEYLAAFSATSPLPAVTRFFKHPKGHFEWKSEGVWDEYEGEGKIWTFQEASRTKNHIELLDTGRNLRLRLTLHEVQLGSNGQWPVIYRGNWDPSQ